MKFEFGLFVALVATSLIFLSGCSNGPATGTVTGVVMIDDKPIANAKVNFFPDDGRASTGTTDSEGKYELVFSRDQKGALLGSHKVTIATETVSVTDYSADDNYDDENDADDGGEQRDELLPAKFQNRESTSLTAEIVSGENVVDFRLKSEEF